MVDAVSTIQLQNTSVKPAARSEPVAASAGIAHKQETPNFVSSSIRVDNLQNVAILEYRSEAGEVVQQYPTQSQIEAFRNAERLRNEGRAKESASQAEPQQAAAPVISQEKTSAPAVVVQAPAAPAPQTDSSVEA